MPKACEGQPNQSTCKVQLFCQEVEPFLVPIEVEIWNQEGRTTLHKYAVRTDDTRAELGTAFVRENTAGHERTYASSGFPNFKVILDLYNGEAKFSEELMGRTLITSMICQEPAFQTVP
jgi:hypothetical protein